MVTLAAAFVAVFGLLIVLTCLRALFQPRWLFEFAKPVLEQGWLIYLAVGIRFLLGVALLLIAEGSAFRTAFTALGWFAIVAAIAVPFIGMARIKTLVDWMETLPETAIRVWVVVGIGLGGFLLLGVRPLFL